MHDLRRTVGVALAVSLLMIFCWFVARPAGICDGTVRVRLRVAAVYLLEYILSCGRAQEAP